MSANGISTLTIPTGITATSFTGSYPVAAGTFNYDSYGAGFSIRKDSGTIDAYINRVLALGPGVQHVYTGLSFNYGQAQISFTLNADGTFSNVTCPYGAGGYSASSGQIVMPGDRLVNGTSPANDILWNYVCAGNDGVITGFTYESGNPSGSKEWTFVPGNGQPSFTRLMRTPVTNVELPAETVPTWNLATHDAANLGGTGVGQLNTSLIPNGTAFVIYATELGGSGGADKEARQVAKLELAQKKRQGYSLYANGTANFGSAQFSGSNYLSVSNAAFTFTGNFTVEGWYYPTNVTGSHSLFCLGPDPANRYVFALSGTSVSSNLYGFGLTTYTSNVPINTWTHIAVVRSVSTVKVYINGVASVTTDTQAGTIGNGTLNIGADAANGALFVGKISNFRVVKGTAVYTTTFTPSLSPLTAIDGTQLLLNTATGAGFLTDSSDNGFTLTNTGSVVTSSTGPGPNTSANFYRTLNEYDITELPTQYSGNTVVDNPNTGGLLPARPWISTP